MIAARARLGSYALWQLRDYFTTVSGVGSILLPAVLGVLPMIMIRVIASKNGTPVATLGPGVQSSFDMLVSSTAWIGAMLSVATLVSADRRPGLTRFLFSKPVGVSDYYLQAWFVRGVALCAIAFVLGQIVNLWVLPVPVLEGVAAVSLSWVLIGGVGLLFSVLTARDGLLLIFVYVMVSSLAGAVKALPDVKWISWILYVMPPMHKLETLRHALLRHTPLPMDAFWHTIGYGAACTALAWYLVRRLPLVR